VNTAGYFKHQSIKTSKVNKNSLNVRRGSVAIMNDKDSQNQNEVLSLLDDSRNIRLKSLETKFERRIQRLFWGTIVVLAIYAATATSIFIFLSWARTEFVENHVKKLIIIKDLEISIEGTASASRAYFLTREASFHKKTHTRHDNAVSVIAELKERIHGPQELTLVDEVESDLNSYFLAVHQIMTAPPTEESMYEAAGFFESQVVSKKEAVNLSLENLNTEFNQQFITAEKKTDKIWRLSFILFGVAALFSGLFFAALRWVLTRALYDKRRAEEARTLSEQISKQAVALTELGVYTRDIIKNQVFMSPELRKICGFTEDEEVSVQSYLNLIPESERPGLQKLMAQAHDPNGVTMSSSEHSIIRRDGTVRWVMAKGQVFFKNYKGKKIPTQAIGVALDITKKKEIELSLRKALTDLATEKIKLERSNSELEQFASIAAHDLRAPITSLMGWIGIVDKLVPKPRDEKINKAIQFINTNAKKAEALISDLLQIARVNTSAANLDVVDVNKIIENLTLILKDLIQSSQAEINVAELPKVIGSPSQLESVFSNLIRNALTYRDDSRPPKIEISCLTKSDFYEFSVSDNGIGIAPQYKNRIFEMFKRLHPESETSGTGIGLAYCKKIVELYGGKIWVESTPQKGSTFYFTYPVSIHQESQQEPA